MLEQLAKTTKHKNLAKAAQMVTEGIGMRKG